MVNISNDPVSINIVLTDGSPAIATLYIPGPAGPQGPQGPQGSGGGGAVSSVNGQTGDVVINAANVAAVPLSQKAAANGVATLDSSGKVPAAQLPAASSSVSSVNNKTGAVTLTYADLNAISATDRGIANGVAALDGAGKVPASQLPANTITSVNGYTGAVSLVATDVGAIATTQKGVANGVASLGADGKVPSAQLPAASNAVNSVNGLTGTVVLAASDVGAIATTAKGAANGVASLDATGKVPSTQIPTAPVTSVNNKTGAVTLVATDVNAEPAGAVANHIAASDPHGDRAYTNTALAGYQAVSQKGVANGYAGLGSDGKVPAAQLPTGSGGGGSTTQVISKKTGSYTLAATDVDAMVIIASPAPSVVPTVINDTFTGADGAAVTSLVSASPATGSSIKIGTNAALVTTGSAGSYSGGVSAMLSTDGTTLLNTADIDITTSFQIIGDVFPGFNVRGPQTAPNGQGGYSINLNNGSTKIGRTIQYSGTTLLDTAVTVTAHVWWTVRFAVYGTNIYLWLVQGKAAIDPNAALSTAQWTYNDTSGSAITASGYHNFNVGGGGAGQQTMMWDDLVVKAGTAVAPASVWTIPTDATATIPVGSTVYGARYTAESVTVAGATGVTVLTTDTLNTRKRYSTWSATKTAANEWLVIGDFS